MLHLYWGDGKGKTTAAMGLALRALGHGRRVVILQFLKDGSSGEIEMLRRCGAVVYACPNAKFTWLMTDAERAEARRTNTRTLQTILQGSFDLLVLDEACAACKNDLVEEALLREAAARAEQIGERGHDRNHREAQAKPCERSRALPRDFADIDTVNYIIEQIEHLRDEHGRGKRQRFAAHAALGKVDLPGRLFLFQTGPSFLLTFCHIFTDSDLL